MIHLILQCQTQLFNVVVMFIYCQNLPNPSHVVYLQVGYSILYTLHLSQPKMSETPLLVVYGATGATGTHVVQQALDANLRVRAYVRNPSKLPSSATSNSNFSHVKGDLTDLPAVTASLEGATYAICVAGNATQSADGLMENMSKAVVAGMQKYSVKKLVYQAGAFSPPPGDKAPMSIKVMRPFMVRILGIRHMVIDNDKVIDVLVAAKGVKWTVTLPGMLKEGASKGKIVARAKAGTSVMFLDLAKFSLELVQSEEHNGKGVYPVYE